MINTTGKQFSQTIRRVDRVKNTTTLFFWTSITASVNIRSPEVDGSFSDCFPVVEGRYLEDLKSEIAELPLSKKEKQKHCLSWETQEGMKITGV